MFALACAQASTSARERPSAVIISARAAGAKVLYPRILALLEPRLSAGALVIADNADHCPEHLTHVRNPANGYLCRSRARSSCHCALQRATRLARLGPIESTSRKRAVCIA
jgi:hypothetical protein